MEKTALLLTAIGIGMYRRRMGVMPSMAAILQTCLGLLPIFGGLVIGAILLLTRPSFRDRARSEAPAETQEIGEANGPESAESRKARADVDGGNTWQHVDAEIPRIVYPALR